jgi:hypothetical protein
MVARQHRRHQRGIALQQGADALDAPARLDAVAVQHHQRVRRPARACGLSGLRICTPAVPCWDQQGAVEHAREHAAHDVAGAAVAAVAPPRWPHQSPASEPSMRSAHIAAPRVLRSARARPARCRAGRHRAPRKAAMAAAALAASGPWPRPSAISTVNCSPCTAAAQPSPQTCSPGAGRQMAPTLGAPAVPHRRVLQRPRAPAPRSPCRRARGMDVEVVRQPAHRAQAGARRAARGVAVAHRERDVRDAGALVDGDQLHLSPFRAVRRIGAPRRDQQPPLACAWLAGWCPARSPPAPGGPRPSRPVHGRRGLRRVPARLADAAGVVHGKPAWVQPGWRLLPLGDAHASALARLGRDVEVVHQALAARQAQAHALAAGPAVGQARAQVGNAGALVLEVQLQAAMPLRSRIPSACRRRRRGPACCATARWPP